MSTMEDIIITKKDGVRTITLNRPTVKNAIDTDMFIFITNLLNNDAADDDIVITILTGTGDFFSSGFDIKRQMQRLTTNDGLESHNAFQNFVAAFINYPKILIAVVNGPAVGIAVTILGLCDVVYASERATFNTPFTPLGVCPEGGSSYLFPRIMGRSLASEMLLFNRKLTAMEALQAGLISRIIPHSDLQPFIESLRQYGKLSVNVTRNNKKLIMWNLKSILLQTNIEESVTLKNCFESEEFAESVMKFMSKKSKL